MPIISLEKLLKSAGDSALDNVVQTAQLMDELTTLLQKDLAADLSANLCAASLREDGELVLIATSSAWASKIRFEAENIMETARKSGKRVTKCRVSVSKYPSP